MTVEKSYDEQIIEELRANGGVAGGRHNGRPLLILTTVGARSGRSRAIPLVYGQDGDDRFVIGSNGGSAKHPAWYHNLIANPEVTVEVGTETYRARALVIEGEERDRLYALLAGPFPFFAEYQKQVARTIPVVRLTRIAD